MPQAIELIPTQGGLQFAGRIPLSRIGAVFPTDLSVEEWKSAGEAFNLANEASYFWIGDWLLAAHTINGMVKNGNNTILRGVLNEVYEQALKRFSISRETLKACKWVSMNVPLNIRNARLSWSHHQQIASLGPDTNDSDEKKKEARDKQTMWIKWAVDNAATIEQLRIAVRASKSNHSKILPRPILSSEAKQESHEKTPITLKGDDKGEDNNLSLIGDACRSLQRVKDWYDENAMENIGGNAKGRLQEDLDPLVEKIGTIVDLYEAMK